MPRDLSWTVRRKKKANTNIRKSSGISSNTSKVRVAELKQWTPRNESTEEDERSHDAGHLLDSTVQQLRVRMYMESCDAFEMWGL